VNCAEEDTQDSNSGKIFCVFQSKMIDNITSGTVVPSQCFGAPHYSFNVFIITSELNAYGSHSRTELHFMHSGLCG
jgi:hypothetical protein